MQYIGVLMRDIDPQLIKTAINQLTRGEHEKVLHFKKIEKWRDSLVGGDNKLLEKLLSTYDTLDRRELISLIKKARLEKDGVSKSKSARMLFRYLNSAIKYS
jgi:ribosome-associated protein